MIKRFLPFRLVSKSMLRSLQASATNASQTEEALTRVERLLARLQRDVDQIKRLGAVVLENDRAVTVLATGQHIYVDPRDKGCGVNILTEGKYEEDELRLFRSFLRPGAVVLDIGANYGYYSIVSAPYVRPNGRVIGFEPNPHIHSLFHNSVYINGLSDVVDARNLGVYDTEGTLAFEIDDAGPGGAHIVSPTDQPPPHHRVINVTTVRLDEHLPPDLSVDLVKIDVESHEAQVLEGMREVVKRSDQIVIFMEFIHRLFPDREAVARLGSVIVEDLGLTINQIVAGGRTRVVDFEELNGQACNLILSKGALPQLPDLTILARQLIPANGGNLVNDELRWTSPGEMSEVREVAVLYGPYVYLPKGSYRLDIDADFEGGFTCRIQEGFGDVIWSAKMATGSGFSADVTFIYDAPRLEILMFADTSQSTVLRFRKATFRLK